MLRNMASSLLRTFDDEVDEAKAKVPGRIVTTTAKAKEVQPFVEKLITLARNALAKDRESEQWGTDAARHSSEWEQWRKSDRWRQWAQARAPLVAARQRALSILRDKHAVQILFDEVAPRYADRPGGYTRVVQLAQRRLGDAGPTAILELVEEASVVSKPSRPTPVVDTPEQQPVETPAAESDAPAAEADPTGEQTAVATEEAPEEPSDKES